MIARNREEPGNRAAVERRKFGGCPPNLDVDFLQRIFSFGPVLHYTDTNAEKFRDVRLIKRSEGDPVAEPDLEDQMTLKKIKSRGDKSSRLKI